MEEGSSKGKGKVRSGPSASEPSSATSEKHPAPSSVAGSQDASGAQVNKRRRGLGIVTPNACTECRKKRAKCDGQKPCGRCRAQKDVECKYEIPVRQSKENLRNEIDQLRRQQRQSDHIISALQRSDLSEEVLSRLRGGQSVENISDWLGGSMEGIRPGYTGSDPPKSAAGVTLPPLSGLTFGLSSTGMPYPSAPVGIAVQHQQQHGARQDYDQNSPWNFSSQSQTQSTRSSSHPDIMQWTTDIPQHSRVGSWIQDQSSEGSRYHGLGQVLAPLDPPPHMKVPAGTWTNITNDSNLVGHLLALYFCWEYPTFASLSKEHFMKDFLDGRHRYCSTMLVNALLALGCRFSTQPETRENPNDPYTSGDHFFKEALRLLQRETRHHSLTTIQALGIMSIREASCGRDSESWYYAGQSMRIAIEMGLHRLENDGDEDELAVQAATFWGAFALDHAWSLATGCLPQCSCFPYLPPKPAIIDDIEASLWIPYTDDGSGRLGAPLQRSCEQPSNVRSVYKCFCELSELVHQSLYVLHSPGKPVTSRDLLNIYTQYLNWYDKVPEVLRLGHNFTPSVLFAHMYYHFAILLLFRPLIKLRIIGSSVLPRDVCTQAADAIQGLSRSYSQLYTLRRTPSFVPYFVLTSAIMHLAVGIHKSSTETPSPATGSASTVGPDDSKNSHSHPPQPLSPVPKKEAVSPPDPETVAKVKLDPRVTEAINQGIADLTEMAPCHHFAEQALNILRYLAKKWSIEVHIPSTVKDDMTVEEADRLVRPQTNSLNFFAPNFDDEDFLCSWGGKNPSGQGGGKKSAPSLTQAVTSNNQGFSNSGGRPSITDVGGIANMEGVLQTDRLESELGAGPLAQTARSIENPLFWPFPMQGRPMVPSGPLLKEAGFTML